MTSAHGHLVIGYLRKHDDVFLYYHNNAHKIINFALYTYTVI